MRFYTIAPILFVFLSWVVAQTPEPPTGELVNTNNTDGTTITSPATQRWIISFEHSTDLSFTNATTYPIYLHVPFEDDTGFIRTTAKLMEFSTSPESSMSAVENSLYGFFAANEGIAESTNADLCAIASYPTTFAPVLIEHDLVLMARHCKLNDGSTVRFTGPYGDVYERTLTNSAWFLNGAGEQDMAIARLDRPVPIEPLKPFPAYWIENWYNTVWAAGEEYPFCYPVMMVKPNHVKTTQEINNYYPTQIKRTGWVEYGVSFGDGDSGSAVIVLHPSGKQYLRGLLISINGTVCTYNPEMVQRLKIEGPGAVTP